MLLPHVLLTTLFSGISGFATFPGPGRRIVNEPLSDKSCTKIRFPILKSSYYFSLNSLKETASRSPKTKESEFQSSEACP